MNRTSRSTSSSFSVYFYRGYPFIFGTNRGSGIVTSSFGQIIFLRCCSYFSAFSLFDMCISFCSSALAFLDLNLWLVHSTLQKVSSASALALFQLVVSHFQVILGVLPFSLSLSLSRLSIQVGSTELPTGVSFYFFNLQWVIKHVIHEIHGYNH